jgi:hypothetical protein
MDQISYGCSRQKIHYILCITWYNGNFSTQPKIIEPEYNDTAHNTPLQNKLQYSQNNTSIDMNKSYNDRKKIIALRNDNQQISYNWSTENNVIPFIDDTVAIMNESISKENNSDTSCSATSEDNNVNHIEFTIQQSQQDIDDNLDLNMHTTISNNRSVQPIIANNNDR